MRVLPRQSVKEAYDQQLTRGRAESLRIGGVPNHGHKLLISPFAFLDLIVELVESEPRRHQFVMSKCGERFLQLVRQSSRHLAERYFL
jgi:hypothetical protein